jgi:ABC-type transport system involved in multi-copper enzyme maturation permease subunit
MGRTIGAVIFGYITTGLLVILTDQIISGLIPGFHSMKTPPLYYFGISLATNTLYAILGGYLCSAVARNQWRTAALGLIILGEVLGIIAQRALWHTVPHWFGIGLLGLYAPAVWIGAYLRSRSKKPV